MKNIKKLQKMLMKQRTSSKNRDEVVLDAVAVQCRDVATEDLDRIDKLSLSTFVQRLSCAKNDARHIFLSSEACSRRAVVVAPKRDAVSVDDAVCHIGHPDIPEQFPVIVPLITINGPLSAPLFHSETNAAATVRDSTSILLGRLDIGGIPVFTLHGANSSPDTFNNTDIVGTPRSIGLSSLDFRAVQRDAARLLGLRLLSDWAVKA